PGCRRREPPRWVDVAQGLPQGSSVGRKAGSPIPRPAAYGGRTCGVDRRDAGRADEPPGSLDALGGASLPACSRGPRQGHREGPLCPSRPVTTRTARQVPRSTPSRDTASSGAGSKAATRLIEAYLCPELHSRASISGFNPEIAWAPTVDLGFQPL